MVFLFHNWYIIYSGVYEIWRFSVQRIYAVKVIEEGIFFTETSDYFLLFYGPHTDFVLKIDTSVSSTMLKGLFTNCDMWLVSSYAG